MEKESINAAQKAYILRTREARLYAGKSRPEVAKHIGIALSTYGNFEVPARHRPMPQEYISAFCGCTGVNERWLVSGKGRKEANYVEQLEAKLAEYAEDMKRFLTS